MKNVLSLSFESGMQPLSEDSRSFGELSVAAIRILLQQQQQLADDSRSGSANHIW